MARSSRGRGTPTREKSWTGLPGLQVAGQADGRWFGSGGLTFEEAATVMRIRGEGVICWTAEAAAELATVAIGICIVNDQAFAAGASSCPDPSDADYPWLWHKVIPFIGVAAGRNASEGSQTHRFEVDTKAMRRVKPQETLCVVVESTGSGAGTTDYVLGQCRVLIAE